ncbi:LCP family protein [Adlercreutzia sp. ZJ304]|uniref:LCP family protein n=1 Tax=Adlercreutzia sp. ZJ304 TaxID=2709791 RepID=UPI0013EB1E0F|nr:LCP family protein [Adlercreutzia sp. ZJ304]
MARRKVKSKVRSVSYGRHASGPSVSARRPTATLVEDVRRKRKHQNIFFGIIAAVVVLAIAIGVGVYAYFANTNAKLDLAPSNAKEGLVAAEANKPYYILCSANLGISPSAPKSYDTPEHTLGYILVRVDESAHSIIFATIPSNTLVRFSNGEYHPLYKAQESGGEAELVRRVADFAGVSINHYVTTTAGGIEAMVDMMGGVMVNLATEIDDPYSGTKVLPAGEIRLDGAQALQFLRAINVPGGLSSVAANRVSFICTLIQRATEGQGLDLASMVSDASKYIDTDLTASDLLELSETFSPFNEASVWQCVVPGSDMTTSDGLAGYNPSTSEWEKMMEKIKSGEDPNALDAAVQNVDTGQTTVEVRNGTLTTGAASQMADILRGAGYQVTGVGNTNDNTIYKETLVVYTSPDKASAAKAVVEALGCGRVVNGGDFYHSSADVISIVGSDWTPAA